MLVATCQNGKLHAWKARKEDGPFYCPGCQWPVIIKHGMLIPPHFAHEPGANCPYIDYHRGESETHIESKRRIFDALSGLKGITDLKLERYLGPVRPDVSFRYNGTPVALEIQISRIDPHTIAKRMREYSRRGISMLWLAPWSKVETHELKHGELYVHMSGWERYIHYVLYHGRFYYWRKDAEVCSVHYKEAKGGYTPDPLLRMRHTAHYPMIETDCALTDLSSFALSVNYTEADARPKKAMFWGKPTVWVDRERRFVEVREAQQQYPRDFLDPAQILTPPFEGDPFRDDAPDDPGAFLDLPPGASKVCPEHRLLYRHSDQFGNQYCNDPVCQSRYSLLSLGTRYNYPEVVGIYDPRKYLPDTSKEPTYVAGPTGRMIAVYPTRPQVTRTLIAAGETSWKEFAATQAYGQIVFALRMLENKG